MQATPNEVISSDKNMMDDEIQKLLAEAEDRLQTRGTEFTETLAGDNTSVSNILNIPKLCHDTNLSPHVQQQGDVVVINSVRKNNYTPTNPTRHKLEQQGPRSKNDKQTAGSDWFDLPKTELTQDLKRDLQLLRMRSILDPKRHYKKENGKAQAPKYSQVGTIIEGPTEFFSGRINKRDRKNTFVEEALAAEQVTKRFESKYKDIQGKKKSGKKSFYKGLQAQRNIRGKRH